MNPHAKHGGLQALYTLLAGTLIATAHAGAGAAAMYGVATVGNLIEWRRAVRPRPIILKRRRRFYD